MDRFSSPLLLAKAKDIVLHPETGKEIQRTLKVYCKPPDKKYFDPAHLEVPPSLILELHINSKYFRTIAASNHFFKLIEKLQQEIKTTLDKTLKSLYEETLFYLKILKKIFFLERIYIFFGENNPEQVAQRVKEWLIQEGKEVQYYEYLECRLHPRKQVELLEEVIAESTKDSPSVIVTNSPYILEHLYNLIYASKLYRKDNALGNIIKSLLFKSELELKQLIQPEELVVFDISKDGPKNALQDGEINWSSLTDVSAELLDIVCTLENLENSRKKPEVNETNC